MDIVFLQGVGSPGRGAASELWGWGGSLGELPVVIHDKEVLALVEELPVNSEDKVAALGELPAVIHDKEVLALVEELPVNSEDEVAALGELPVVIHDKEVSALVEELPVNSEDEWEWQP